VVAAIVQARMSSTRLPDKVLRPLAARPALAYVLERLAQCRTLDSVTVATSTEPEDDPVEAFCGAAGVRCFRGPHENVAARYAAAVEEFALDAFVRLSGDSPLLDQALVDQGVDLFRERRPDLVTNVFPRTFPRGQSVEVVDAAVFALGFGRMEDPEDLEHVTRFFYRHADEFAIESFAAEEDLSHLSLALDAEEDAARIERVLGAMERPHWEYGYREVVRLAWPR
jgi:spore coat polysaccharide biosynthesis protein SpsF